MSWRATIDHCVIIAAAAHGSFDPCGHVGRTQAQLPQTVECNDCHSDVPARDPGPEEPSERESLPTKPWSTPGE
jgi:hypothetical protein